MLTSEGGPPPLDAGTPLAPGYEVVSHLRRGNDLDVYEVWSEERTALCVAKTLRPDRTDHASTRRRLEREGRLLLRLSHPHIVRAYELIRVPRQVLILETLTGATVGWDVESRSRRMPALEIAFLGLHLCSAMRYVHRQGILHLDLKPSNVISDQGLAKVIDLSIARRPGRGRAGVGSRPYMAPEQASGGTLSEATDVWGIGTVLFAAATGRKPFDGADDDAGYPQLGQRANRVGTHRRLPGPLARAIDACLEPEPSHRPTTVQLACSLDGLLPLPAPAEHDGFR